MLWRLLGILLLSGVCISTNAGDSPSFSTMKTVLDEHYPNYEIVKPDGPNAEAIESPENVIKGIVIGDFNSDGAKDFAAELRRPIREGERKRLTDNEIRLAKRSGIRGLVVCNGTSEGRYSCCTPVTPEPGHLVGTLDYREWDWENSAVFNAKYYEGSPQLCRAKLKARKGQKTLSLVNPITGKGGAFFYPLENNEYGTCQFAYRH